MTNSKKSSARIVRVRVAFVAMSAVLMMACAPKIVESELPQRPARTALILTGAGMVPSSAQDPRYEATWREVASRYAGALAEEINSAGPYATLHVVKNREDAPQKVLVRLVNEEKKDALVQVTIRHVRTGSENTIYLETEFMPLMYNRLSNGRRTVIPQSGMAKRYPMFSTTSKDMRDAPISDLAKQFVSELRKQGHLR